MVLRTFFAIDSDNLVVTSSSSAGLVGNGIINNSDTPDGTVFVYSSGGGTTVTIDDAGAFADNIPEDNNLFFNDDEPTDHVVTDGGGIVANGQNVEAESTILIRALDAMGNPTGPTIELTVFSQGGVTQDVWGFSSSQELVDGVSYIKVGGDNDGTSPYTDFIPCFEAATLIETRSGPVAAEDISPGDLIRTRDAGFQPVRWVGSAHVAATGDYAPVTFEPGVIGNGTQLTLSPEHRVFLQDARAELLFGSAEVLVAAKHFVGLPGVTWRSGGRVHYVHIMCDAHQIIYANGAMCESFFLSENAVSAIDAAHRKELLSLFPSLTEAIRDFGDMAAPALRGFEASVLRDHMAAQSATAG
ncbi:Hint domain-containing protein [Cognatiyoonia sp. IB215182]|uniref:Hint domain-containing protein n=1 Tax=Cognatiyoonia sp. IB215182 TaxID=3097353 RepID=UPI002A167971|nr:Hint domain-containing protein [Cognatiyoonia sp. IB215182]MDX8352830.1 Hint domain-containing protein [Cognatiyoonia sp. IB215182]